MLVSRARPFTDLSVKGLPSETNFFTSDYKSLEKEHLFVSRVLSPFCVDELFWLIVSFRIVMGVIGC